MKKTKKYIVIETIRRLLFDSVFVSKHKKNSQDFTRVRKLTFQLLLITILRKSVKSVQLVLNEIIKYLPPPIMSISNVAYCKGKAKILHTAFIELNQIAILGVTYSDESLYKRYKGFRLLAVDGSKVRLPNTEEIKKEFGTVVFKNQQENVMGENAFAIASVLYDVENCIALDTTLTTTKKSEKALAISHLKHIQKKMTFSFLIEAMVLTNSCQKSLKTKGIL
jgi:hypothetical protein